LKIRPCAIASVEFKAMKWVTSGALVAVLMLGGACSKPEPIRIGFLGGLSDRNADMGATGLEAVQLAVEQINRAGGVQGRRIELVARDDAQNPDTARRATQELIDAQVEAVIGPFTSSMASVAVPLLGKAGVWTVSPTVTAMKFHGQDDHLFRINRTTRDNARDYARVLMQRGQRRIAVAYDLRNASFTESWLQEFRSALDAAGGHVTAAVPYTSTEATHFQDVLQRMLVDSPEGLFFIASAVDVAHLAQAARTLVPHLPIGASEWAASEQLTQLGGSVVEGLLILQSFDRQDTAPRFLAFTETFQQHFQKFPGYTAVMAYDAATVVLQALQHRQPGETLKAAALRAGPYDGLQQSIVFDAHGDTQRHVVFTEIHSGQFVKIHP
jgi:branched-chain amino acid transport system substrate-binding protein